MCDTNRIKLWARVQRSGLYKVLGFIDFGVNICEEGYNNRGRGLYSKAASDRGNTVIITNTTAETLITHNILRL